MADLAGFLVEHAVGDLLPWSVQLEASERYGVSVAAVEEEALEHGFLPARYQRNRQVISTAQQRVLFGSRVAVIGCGGLGGYLVEQLARLGVGNLTVIDPDIFEEHNLNRQLLSTPSMLGMPKVDVAAARVREINPAVSVSPVREAVSTGNGTWLLQGADVAVDGLDTLTARAALAHACRDLRIPVVHGAIGGWYGQVSVQMPEDTTSPILFGAGTEPKGIETRLGNPAFTPAVVASLQVAETCKLLLGLGTSLAERMLFVNLHDMEMEDIRLIAPA